MRPVYRIFVSSPGDVGREREVTQKVIERVNARLGGRAEISGYFWEHEPMRLTRGDFQTQIEEPSRFDLVITILWSRLGSRLHPGHHHRPDGSSYMSGTEFEFENAALAHRARGTPDLLVYRRSEMPTFAPEPPEENQRRLEQWLSLKAFCDKWFRDEAVDSFKAAYNSYKDSEEYQAKLEVHLAQLVRDWLEHRQPGTPSSDTGRLPTWTHESPYRGLNVFEFHHEAIFFGRTRARDEALGALQARQTEERCPFLLILGASGSGKSSLLRAGVLPWLVRPGVIEGVGLWRHAIWRPSEGAGDLIEGLTAALTRSEALPELLSDGTTAAELTRTLRDEPRSIVGLVKGALSQAAAREQHQEHLTRQPIARLALGFDQLEEIFTLQNRFTPDDRLAFFLAIETLVRSGYAWTVMTLRSDFYSHCELIPSLVELKQGRGQYHLLAPTGADLSQMIRYPAEAAGVTFEEDPEKGKLDEVIRDTALTQAGALPLLQYVLDELYRRGSENGVLTHADYAAIGGVAGALSRRAEATFAGLSAASQAAFPEVARQLVQVNEVAQGVRRPADYSTFVDKPAARQLVDAFVSARLFVTDITDDERPTVLVAHEALFRAWKRFADWIRENQDELATRARIEQQALVWSAKSLDTDYLLPSGKPLEEAEDMFQRQRDSLSELARQFVAQSILAVEEAAAETHRERCRRALRLRERAAVSWSEFQARGIREDHEWRFARLAEIETDLVESLTLQPDVEEAEKLLAGIRRLVVETGIQTKDLVLASIYLQRLKAMPVGANASAGKLTSELDLAWGEVDPRRNADMRRLRKWALMSTWLPLVIFVLMEGPFLSLANMSETRSSAQLELGAATYLLVTFLPTWLLLSIATVNAGLASSGERQFVARLYWAVFIGSIVSPFSLNPAAIIANLILMRIASKLMMAKIFWTELDPPTKPGESPA